MSRKKKRKCECGAAAAPSRPNCYKCRSRQTREKNPIMAVYYDLKSNAKRRKKEFTITPAYLMELVTESGYMENRGRTRECLSFDRIKNELGYVPGNMQVMKKGANSEKWHEDRKKIIEDGIIIADETDTEYQHPF